MDNLQEAFWSKVQRKGPDDCWLWTGAKTGGYPGLTYGAFCFGGRHIQAHRFAYSTANGKIPDGQVVMHGCDNPMCVNPNHLEVGSQSKNIKDAAQKGRWMSDKRTEHLAGVHERHRQRIAAQRRAAAEQTREEARSRLPGALLWQKRQREWGLP